LVDGGSIQEHFDIAGTVAVYYVEFPL